ncbi:hypothetical protein AABB02_33715 [Streptomyces rimosus]|uniref:hypothetical protein n=1 Tax=Streptomyces rimosus TaxID=1927 RepID=UPI0031D7B077
MTRAEFKGVVDGADETEQRLERLADLWPLGAQVVHIPSGRKGVIRLDEPSNVPGRFHGRPTAWCLRRDEEAVSVLWDNADGILWRVWVPVSALLLAGRGQ